MWWLLTVWAVSNDSLGLLPWLLVLSSASVALTLIDLEHFRLPNAIVYPLYPVLLVGLVVSAFVDGEVPWTSALIGAGAWFAVIGGIWLVTRGRGMGLGDVKLAPVLGATLGWVSVGSALVGLPPNAPTAPPNIWNPAAVSIAFSGDNISSANATVLLISILNDCA